MYKIWRERGEPCRHLWGAIYSQRLIVVTEETKELRCLVGVLSEYPLKRIVQVKVVNILVRTNLPKWLYKYIHICAVKYKNQDDCNWV